VRGFEFDIHSTKARFIREISLELGESVFDAKTGAASFDCNGYVSNAGTAEGAMDVRFSADLVLLCMPPGSMAAAPLTAEGDLNAVTENKAFPLSAKF